MARLSIHVEPHGAVGIARHYIGDLVYGATNVVMMTSWPAQCGGAPRPFFIRCWCGDCRDRVIATARPVRYNMSGDV